MLGRFRNIRRPRRKGSTFVEGALVLSVVIFTLIGIADLGQVLVLHQGLVERVRAGARWAVVNPFDSTQIKNVVVYNNPAPANDASALLMLNPTMVSATLHNPETPEARVAVQITNYPFHFFSPLIAGRYRARPISASMPVENQ